MLAARTKRRAKEYERQLQLIKQWNQKKAIEYDWRLDKILRLYPIYELASDMGLDKFYRAVENAEADRLNSLIEAFSEENHYWNTYYVMHKCNNQLYEHIMNVLDKMHNALAAKVNNRKDLNETIQNSDSEEVDVDRNDWGKQGEKEVDYVLKWLPSCYHSIKKNCRSKYNDHCILLVNDEFVDENQEYDHIVVGPQGVFIIETKNYSGKLNIDASGNWIRMKKGETEWIAETNPIQQVNRHHVLLESILGPDIPIIDAVCLSHPELLVSGQENSRIPVIKKDLLGDFIMNYKDNQLSKSEIDDVIAKIEDHKISK